MRNGIAGLRGYQNGGLRYPTAEDRRSSVIRPRPPWAERVAAQVRSVPRRINRALQPETGGETAALVGASMVPGVGEGIDIADIIAGARTGDLPRMGWGAAGFALPLVAGSTLRKIAQRGARRITGPAIRIKVDGEDVIISSPQSGSHLDVLKKHPEVPNTPIKQYDDEFVDMEIFDRIEEMKQEGVPHSDIFGFVDSDGKFLEPHKAGAVAYDAGQLNPQSVSRRSSPIEGGGRVFHDLWSEDLSGIASLLGLGAAGAARRNYVER
jgi:hypothetical protein